MWPANLSTTKVYPDNRTVIVRNVDPECVPDWLEWGYLLCRMANFGTLTIDPLTKRPKNCGIVVLK
ncbi:hypothetical protein LCGC14_0141270 [marine sediment metagenome]|uniref:Uncharacterized protein n=1 Tax=marine sediment metagenome TaxID=412755 RepID=A0A0F9XI87_9ZZZZ